MTNKEFDLALQQIEASETFPFDEHNWDSLNKRLDNKERRKLLLLPFLNAKQWAAAAFAGSLIVITSLYIHYAISHHENNPNQSIAESIASNTPVKPTAHNNTPKTRTAAKLNAYTTRNTAPITRQLISKQEPENTINNEATNIIDTSKDLPVADSKKQITDAFKKTEPRPYYFMEELPSHAHKMGLSLNGGIGVSGGGAIAAGVIFRNRLSRTISLETSIGYAQGSQNILVKNEGLAFDPGNSAHDTSHVMGVTSEESKTWYEQHKRTLPYLQFSPALSIKVHQKIRATIGVDLQRLLIDARKLDDINDELRSSNKKLPQLDPGVTAGLSYAITKRIGAGVAYRQSVVNITSGKDYISRNYFLVQVQYSIIK